jgi:prevent-host-death family protein
MELTPVTVIKRRATEIIAELKRDRRPRLITQRGRSAAVLVDVETFEDMQARLEILEGIARGERAIDEGRHVTHAEARRRLLKKWRARAR